MSEKTYVSPESLVCPRTHPLPSQIRPIRPIRPLRRIPPEITNPFKSLKSSQTNLRSHSGFLRPGPFVKVFGIEVDG